jgi:hypothetical protein
MAVRPRRGLGAASARPRRGRGAPRRLAPRARGRGSDFRLAPRASINPGGDNQDTQENNFDGEMQCQVDNRGGGGRCTFSLIAPLLLICLP